MSNSYPSGRLSLNIYWANLKSSSLAGIVRRNNLTSTPLELLNFSKDY